MDQVCSLLGHGIYKQNFEVFLDIYVTSIYFDFCWNLYHYNLKDLESCNNNFSIFLFCPQIFASQCTKCHNTNPKKKI